MGRASIEMPLPVWCFPATLELRRKEEWKLQRPCPSTLFCFSTLPTYAWTTGSPLQVPSDLFDTPTLIPLNHNSSEKDKKANPFWQKTLAPLHPFLPPPFGGPPQAPTTGIAGSRGRRGCRLFTFAAR